MHGSVKCRGEGQGILARGSIERSGDGFSASRVRLTLLIPEWCLISRDHRTGGCLSPYIKPPRAPVSHHEPPAVKTDLKEMVSDGQAWHERRLALSLNLRLAPGLAPQGSSFTNRGDRKHTLGPQFLVGFAPIPVCWDLVAAKQAASRA